ncbi:MAG: S-methyl-5-thioribose-1-phosphate isomerase [Planctomycetes bacterium]|nr:S-methyl-5-thioribose-1-phosphate isomerase [Planctomycetota bacterium]
MTVETVAWTGLLPGKVRLVDQTRLPLACVYVETDDVAVLCDAIRRLVVRGAPAIGVAAAYGVVLAVQAHADAPGVDVVGRAKEACAFLASSRPTAVNLFWALERMARRAERELLARRSGAEIVSALHAEARAIHAEDAAACRRMGELGAAFLKDGATVLTHCNSGALATGGMGTALAPIYVAKERGLSVRVFADETRPLLQGARLTAWELANAGIDVTLITDGMAARVFGEGKIDAVFVGADRIARNGDVCNKIGTYGVAILAREHGVPFYVVAPVSTFDAKIAHGGAIPIEERAAEEVTQGFGARTAPPGVRVYNPAFDVTPARLVTAIVTEAGVITAPDEQKVVELLARAHPPSRS